MKEKNFAEDNQNQDDPEDNASTAEDVMEVVEEELLDELENLKNELAECQTKSAEYLDGWQRARADFANYKKRVEREQTQTYQNAAASIFKRFLDIQDDLDRALKNRPKDADGAGWAEGIELIYRKFYSILESEGVSVMETENQYFDPNLHEAISMEENKDYESGQIIEVVKNGYMIGDRVLRVATVRVAK
jgi:molecular chaperone GrpE